MIVQIATSSDGSVDGYYIVGTLSDCIACSVRQEYNNGVYQLSMSYPPNGVFSNLLTIGNRIVCRPDRSSPAQSFYIASVRRALSDLISVTAYHVGYLHASEICAPFLNGGAVWSALDAWEAAVSSIVNPLPGAKICAITSTEAGAFGIHLLRPQSFRELIFDQLLPAYGGQVTWDNMTVRWSPEKHPDRGVRLIGAVNVLGCTVETDAHGMESGIYPYYGEKTSESKPYMDLGEPVSYGIDAPTNIIAVDFSSDFETPPTVEQLRAVAERYAAKKAAEYHPYAISIERVPDGAVIMPGDIVHIHIRQMGIDVDRVVSAINFDVLRGVVDAVEVGDQDANTLAKIIAKK